MEILSTIKRRVTDPLFAFKGLQSIIALVCIFIPVIFRVIDKDIYSNVEIVKGNTGPVITHAEWVTKDSLGFRESLSHYALCSNSYYFGFFYCMAAMLFIFNGVIYMKNNMRWKSLCLHSNGWVYNIAIGLSLVGVVFNPVGSSVLHLIFSILFFLLNILVIAFFPNPREKKLSRTTRYIMAALATLGIIFSFKPGGYGYPLVYGEWIALTFVAIHLILVAGHVDYIDKNKSNIFKKKSCIEYTQG